MLSVEYHYLSVLDDCTDVLVQFPVPVSVLLLLVEMQRKKSGEAEEADERFHHECSRFVSAAADIE